MMQIFFILTALSVFLLCYISSLSRLQWGVVCFYGMLLVLFSHYIDLSHRAPDAFGMPSGWTIGAVAPILKGKVIS